jgi:hypothetical protein
LTTGKGEVLSWLSNGKPNQDIAQILSRGGLLLPLLPMSQVFRA